MPYTILVDKISKEAITIFEEPVNVFYNEDSWITLNHIIKEYIIDVCINNGFGYSMIVNQIEELNF